MTDREFIYWLQGFFELSGAKSLNESQTEVIRNHLNLLFDKKTPDIKTAVNLVPQKLNEEELAAAAEEGRKLRNNLEIDIKKLSSEDIEKALEEGRESRKDFEQKIRKNNNFCHYTGHQKIC